MNTLEPLGDRAVLAHFDTEREAGAWAFAVRRQGWEGVVDVVAAYRTAAVFADPDEINLDELEQRLRTLKARPEEQFESRLATLPVLYEGEDLAEVGHRLGLSTPEVIALHTGTIYDVFAIGFLPGFPYAGDLPEPLSGLARRDVPRVRVPAGSVAIAGRQTAVYPVESPGGWHLLGRTPLVIAELKTGFFPLRAGDRIRFEPINAEQFEARLGNRLETVKDH